MDSAVAGLIGAAIGALAAIASAFMAGMLQNRQEHGKWLRDRKQEAYANSVKYIFRVLNKRSEIKVEGGKVITVLGKEATKEWFDEITEALIWMTALSIYCSAAEKREIAQAVEQARAAISNFMDNATTAYADIATTFSAAYKTILSSAKRDLAR